VPAAAAVFFALLFARSPGFWGFVLRRPAAFDAVSLRLWLGWALWPAALAAAAWAAALGVGRGALRILRAREHGGLGDVAAAALGLGLLGQAVFLLGSAGGLSERPLAALCVGAVVLAGAGFGRPPLPLRAPRLGPVAGAAAGLLAFAAFCAFVDAAAPPVSWDARAYHLALPELALNAGRFAPVPWMIHSHWPHLMEALYVLPLAAGRDGAAAMLHLGASVLFAAAVALAARRAAGPAAGWTAALLLVGQPALLAEAGTAHADAACALLAFAAARQLARFDEEGGGGRLAAAGLLAGFSAAAKMTGLAAVAGGAAFLLWRRRPRNAALYLAAASLAVGPWLAKTWWETGDPFWPLASRAGAAAELAARYLRSNRWSGAPPAWLLVHDGPLFLLLPAAALAALVPRPAARASALERVLLFSVPFFLALTWRHHEAWRFLMPAWPCLALAASRRAADALARGGARAAFALALVAAGAAPIVALAPNNALFAVAAPRPESAPGADRRVLFEDRSVDAAAFERGARAVLPPGARVLLFREVRGYGAGFDYAWGDPVNQDELDYRALADPDALYARLRALGVTHVLDHADSALYAEDPSYYDRRTLALMAECLRRHARPALSRDGFALHELL
jgi:hypothetical protein